MQLAVLKIISLRSYHGYRLTLNSFIFHWFICSRKVVSYITITIAKPLHGSTYELLSLHVGKFRNRLSAQRIYLLIIKFMRDGLIILELDRCEPIHCWHIWIVWCTANKVNIWRFKTKLIWDYKNRGFSRPPRTPPCVRACGCELGMDRYGCTQPLAQCASDSSSDVACMPGSRDFCLFCKREYVTSKIKVAQITNEAGILYKYNNTIGHLSIRSEFWITWFRSWSTWH